MNVKEIIDQLDHEIERLQSAKALLIGGTSATHKTSSTKTRKPRKPMSREARAKIAAAQKKRWAAQKRAK